MSSDFSHLNAHGHAAMVDVTAKAATHRIALAACTVDHIEKALVDIQARAGEPALLAGARVAGLGAAKMTSTLIPLCHPLPLTDLEIEFDVRSDSIEIVARAETVGQTGVEMEALTACAVAALSIVTAARARDPLAQMNGLTLWEKRGGRSGTYRRETTTDSAQDNPKNAR